MQQPAAYAPSTVSGLQAHQARLRQGFVEAGETDLLRLNQQDL
jgi:hypothetical protein